ncbi:hypothetical protein FACS1894162_7880 [Bacteroidia bacterium]|nr:hypothetical protein FACS1894162_7880 [Bacteroidia bacterium]
MEQATIKQLLERYWQCETSLEEETTLRAFFSGQEIPEELKQYQALFAWEKKQKNITANKANIFAQPKKTIKIAFYPLLKIAASVLIVATFGISVYTYYQQEKRLDTAIPLRGHSQQQHPLVQEIRCGRRLRFHWNFLHSESDGEIFRHTRSTQPIGEDDHLQYQSC